MGRGGIITSAPVDCHVDPLASHLQRTSTVDVMVKAALYGDDDEY
jgi:hypothetical protein